NSTSLPAGGQFGQFELEPMHQLSETVPHSSGKNGSRESADPAIAIPPFKTASVAVGWTVKIAGASRGGPGNVHGNSVASRETVERRGPRASSAWVNIGASTSAHVQMSLTVQSDDAIPGCSPLA